MVALFQLALKFLSVEQELVGCVLGMHLLEILLLEETLFGARLRLDREVALRGRLVQLYHLVEDCLGTHVGQLGSCAHPRKLVRGGGLWSTQSSPVNHNWPLKLVFLVVLLLLTPKLVKQHIQVSRLLSALGVLANMLQVISLVDSLEISLGVFLPQ